MRYNKIISKRIKNKKKKNKGFTLIELLAVILILAIVLSITGFLITNVIESSKQKQYKIVVNNVQKVAENYILEYKHEMFWLNSNDENVVFQCVQIQNLIDSGYFDTSLLGTKINEEHKIDSNDYIYIEMNNKSKTVTKKEIVIANDDNELKNTCINIKNKVYIDAKYDNDNWAKEKEVEIEYTLLVRDYEIPSYKYNYSVNNNSDIKGENLEFTKRIKKEKIKLNKNGTVHTSIIKTNNIDPVVTKNFIIEKIDNEGPIIIHNYKGDKIVRGNVTIPLVLSDNNGIGVNENSFSTNDIEVIVGDLTLTTGIELEKVDKNNYNLIINNNKYSGKVKLFIGKDKVFDELNNGNNDMEMSLDLEFDRMVYDINYDANGGSDAPETQKKYYGESLLLSEEKPTRKNYEFIGWGITASSLKATYAAGSSYTLNEDITLYAIWKQLHTLPIFTYTGKYELVEDNDTIIASGNNSKVVIPTEYQSYTGNWKIRFLTTGVLTFHELRSATDGIDVFLVGGGGNGGGTYARGAGYWGYSAGGGGGGGGQRLTKKGVNVYTSSYGIIIGGAGQASSGFNYSANGGTNGDIVADKYLAHCEYYYGGVPGTGGARGGYGQINVCGYGNYHNGENGGLEFDDSIYTKYYGGGGGGGHGHNGGGNLIGTPGKGGSGGGGSGNNQYRVSSSETHNGKANTGGGGGGASYVLSQTYYSTYFGDINSAAQSNIRGTSYSAGTGGAGIVIIRNKR